jgi:hypothetical protein
MAHFPQLKPLGRQPKVRRESRSQKHPPKACGRMQGNMRRQRKGVGIDHRINHYRTALVRERLGERFSHVVSLTFQRAPEERSDQSGRDSLNRATVSHSAGLTLTWYNGDSAHASQYQCERWRTPDWITTHPSRLTS